MLWRVLEMLRLGLGLAERWDYLSPAEPVRRVPLLLQRRLRQQHQHQHWRPLRPCRYHSDTAVAAPSIPRRSSPAPKPSMKRPVPR